MNTIVYEETLTGSEPDPQRSNSQPHLKAYYV